jgi:[acyl-carrier-protein] S-malonyltransferase
VVAGETDAVKMLTEICIRKGAKRAIILPVSAPFHCSLLRPAGEKLAHEFDKIKLVDMKYPVIANVNAKPITDKNAVKDLLVRQVSNSVLWEESVRTMISMGIHTFVEIGPGKVLTGFIKRIDKEVRALNIENVDSLDLALNELK